MSNNISTPIVKKSNKNVLIIIGFLVTAFLLTVIAYAMSLSSAVPSDFELTRVSSGGISGSSDTIEIDGDELTHEYSNYPIMYNEYDDYNYNTISSPSMRKPSTTETYTLTDDESKELIKMIKDADFYNLDDDYNENECCDMMGYTITITMNGETKKVSFSDSYDGDETPDELTELDDYITELSEKAE